MTDKPKITKGMLISQVVAEYPKTAFIFMDFGLHCIGCPAAQSETIEEAASLHQIDLAKLLEHLNKAAVKN